VRVCSPVFFLRPNILLLSSHYSPRLLRLKWHESWLHDSFLSLDPELIEKNHGTAQKNMHRCVRAFEKLENEGCTQIAAAIKQQVGVCARGGGHSPCVATSLQLWVCVSVHAKVFCADFEGW
jgi:hypothetical protein